MWCHERSNEIFDYEEQAEEDLKENLNLDDLVEFGDFDVREILYHFVHYTRGEFEAWMDDQLDNAEMRCCENMVYETDDEEDAE